jgi:hypothetical protein
MFQLPLFRTPAPTAALGTLVGLLLASPASAQPQPGAEPEPAPAASAPSAAPAAPPTPTANPSSPFKQKERGFALFCNFTARLFMVDSGGTTNPTQEALSGGLFAGYKLDRLVVGLGFDLSSFDTFVQYTSGGNSSKITITNTGFLVAPGAQFAILRTADRRFELIGAAQLGLGSVVSRTVRSPDIPPEFQVADDSSTFYLTYRLAPGLRFWPYPHLAFSVLTGFGGDYLFTFHNNPSGNQTDQNGTTAFFFNLGALGVF